MYKVHVNYFTDDEIRAFKCKSVENCNNCIILKETDSETSSNEIIPLNAVKSITVFENV